MHLFVLPLAHSLDLEIRRRENRNALVGWNQPLLRFRDDAIESFIVVIAMPTDDVHLEGAFTSRPMRENAFTKPDDVRVCNAENFLEISFARLSQQIRSSGL